MNSLLPWINLLLALPGGWIVLRIQQIKTRALAGTTLTGPARWMQFGLLFWILAQVAALPVWPLSEGVVTRLQMLALSLLLAPFVSVLGAKRPGARVWDAFIVFPMLLVLNWPAWAGLLSGHLEQPVDLEITGMLAVGVVLLLTLGNYFGTCFTSAAFVTLVSIAGGWTELSSELPQWETPIVARCLVSLGMWVGYGLAVRNRRNSHATQSGLETVWFDLRDWFGILWTRRIMERINQTARHEKWPLQIGLDGFHWSDAVDPATRAQTEQKLEQSLRWLLRRFVDDAWIDRRLPPK